MTNPLSSFKGGWQEAFELLDNVESTQHVHSNLAWCGPGMRAMFSNVTKDLTVERRGGMDLLAYIPSLQVVGLYGREREVYRS
jgi:hypothetical protein